MFPKIASLLTSALAVSAAVLPRAELPTIVFTPGAWHGPQSFDLVRAGLTLKGYESEAITLPSVGAEPATVSLDEDAAVLRSTLTTLADAGKQIVLVVHSYGGMVGANAVSGLGYQQRANNSETGGVIMMVYLAAFAAPTSTSLVDMLSGEFLPWMRADVSKSFDTFSPALSFDIRAPSASASVTVLHPCLGICNVSDAESGSRLISKTTVD